MEQESHFGNDLYKKAASRH